MTTEPSTYTRLSRNPDTRAAMFTACELCVCATNTELIGTSRGATVSTVTSACGRAGAPFSSLPQPPTNSAAADSASRGNHARIERVWGVTSFMEGP